MGGFFYLILCSYGIHAVLPTVTFPPKAEDSNSQLIRRQNSALEYQQSNWKCPHVTDVVNISCTCDIPHTIRCRGHVSSSHTLFNVTKELRKTKDPTTTVSLLDLTVHGIGHLEGFTFEGLSLLGLVISSAGLQTLSKDAFKGLESDLAALGLPSNKLKFVPFDALRVLIRLRRLDLSNNYLKVLKSREFPTLVQLQNLDLSGNSLRVIEPEAFVRLPQLKTLILDWNQLDASQISNKTLRGLHFLSSLSLQSNLLKGSLTSEFLNAAPKLISLNLSNNSFTKISFGALENCQNLEILDLSNNHIDVITDHAFKYLTKLKHLKLSHNNIISVSGWSLAHLPNLISLSLADNALFAVTADLLHQLHNLTTLDLTSNDITLLQPNVFNYTPSLSTLSLADNPLHCDCSLSWLWAWLKSHPHLKTENKNNVVCATPPALENAPLVDVNISDLSCSKEAPDYYHDGADYEELYDIPLSDAEVSLQEASWINDVVQLVWAVEQRAIPYTCQAVHIYEIENEHGTVHQILAEKLEVNCSSESQLNPHQVVISVPGSLLRPGGLYRYCLVLLEHGTNDEGSFLAGCSDKLLLTDPESDSVIEPKVTKITSLTAGNMDMSLVVQTRINGHSISCLYDVIVINEKSIVASRHINCSDQRQVFKSLDPGLYIICVQAEQNSTVNLEELEEHLKTSSNTSSLLLHLFPACTKVNLQEESRSKWNSGPLLTLLFTLPGLAFIITLYIIGRRIWKGGGVPWRWDPRASKRAKYFLYTGEAATSTVSLDPLPVPVPESSV
ncbi:Leucine-rich repeats and immunoglobulin-like domains protein 2 [Armadillidium nasatum]|uniref:Leucine-rich repeats and immunoglobulin-like domains protein 2 n=1 Tax=Armadillidium nasatum TaxID=96803 RepID=A0A5N5TMH9_9CRUS|nr:Leucine-rich repeats and immunoglobulin-like domains protein 2 [Armadillidium nasatum]